LLRGRITRWGPPRPCTAQLKAATVRAYAASRDQQLLQREQVRVRDHRARTF
jgi:hypothetical protein